MQAVVLVGGKGVRLQPLTLTTPKPLVPVANRPVIEHIVAWLEQSSIGRVILATQYQASAFDTWIADWHGIPVQAVEEPVPLGTAGAVANVARFLQGTTAIINGDNITDIDLPAMLHAHRQTEALVTIGVAEVDDPTGRGVAVMDQTGRITRFQEKPAPGTALARTVNTGTYIVEPEVLALMTPGQYAMWETDIFPALIAQGKPVYGFAAPHLWLDAGTPAGYFAVQDAILSGAVSAPAGMERGGIWRGHTTAPPTMEGWRPPIALGEGTTIAATVRLVGPLSVGDDCRILDGAHLEHSAIWDHCHIEANATVVDSIIGYNTHIEAGAIVEGALVGDGTVIRSGARIERGSRIAPGSKIEPA